MKEINIKNIVIFGEMGSGKSTVAKYLCGNYGFTKFSFGEKIHSECRLHGGETRTEMQKYGQSMRQIFGENIWCDYVYNKSKGINKICIDDGRQINEFYYYLTKGFLPIAVVTDSTIRLKRLSQRVNYEIDPETFNHETEVQARECIKMCDIKIYNNESYEDLIYEIELKLGKYLEGGM